MYQYGSCVLAAGPAILLAQVSALFTVLPVFGKANKDLVNNSASSIELMTGSKGHKYLSLDKYLHRRFRSTSLSILVAVLVYVLWTLVAVSLNDYFSIHVQYLSGDFELFLRSLICFLYIIFRNSESPKEENFSCFTKGRFSG